MGADGTSIWSAATSGPCAVAVHLLVCILARMFESIEATSILVELVGERKKEIQRNMNESEIRNLTDAVLIAQEVSRTELARWDASARSWIRSVDEVKKRDLTQLRLITKNIGLSIPATTKTYRNVIDTWLAAMTTLERLIRGIPQRVPNAAALIGISAWHIFPDLIVVGEKSQPVEFNDALVHPGGRITLGLQSSDLDDCDGIRWSLSLSHLRYYGEPVPISKATTTDSTRVTMDELYMVALGSAMTSWSDFTTDPLVAARLLCALWDSIQDELMETTQEPSRDQKDFLCGWLRPLASAARQLLELEKGPSKNHAMMLTRVGSRRGRNFLGPVNMNSSPFFGRCDRAVLLTTFEVSSRSEEDVIEILRRLAKSSGFSANTCLIRYYHDGMFEYATALPQTDLGAATLKRDRYGNKIQHPPIKHQRWVSPGSSSIAGCECRINCIKEDAGMCSCPASQPYCNCSFKQCICRKEGRFCSFNCRHGCNDSSYDCGNFPQRPTITGIRGKRATGFQKHMTTFHTDEVFRGLTNPCTLDL